MLEDLVKINNDRIEGYNKAISQTNDTDLKLLFERFAGDSRQFAAALNKELRALGEERERDTTVSGKIYRTWMGLKATFGGTDRHTILASCEYGEDAAQKAYREALNEDYLPADLRAVITQQQVKLRSAHDEIRHMRDVEAVNK